MKKVSVQADDLVKSAGVDKSCSDGLPEPSRFRNPSR